MKERKDGGVADRAETVMPADAAKRRKRSAQAPARPVAPPPRHPTAPAPWVTALLGWYAANKRTMPWRGHPDPYAVWVSEIMLQQTQVDTVRPYFARFLEAFPTIAALAAAADAPLLKAWEGLGYYTRVRNLRKAAQAVMSAHAGALPRTAEGLRALPGIGAYTAAAIASICFGEPVPVVDGNVARVFARRNALPDDFKKEAPRRALAAWLTPHIVASGSPADFNQAMMELGALVCTPHNPACLLCPLRRDCRAAAEGTQEAFPVAPARKALPERKGVAVIVRDAQGRLLLARHTGERLLEGFWELPERARLPFPSRRTRRLGTYRQTFSHFRLTLSVHRAPTPEAPPPLPEGFVWCAEPSALPLTTATRKILAAYPEV